MYNHYLAQEVSRMRREEALARAEHERMLEANGLDLWSVVRRAVAERLARLRRPSVRAASRERRLPASRFAPR